MAVIKFEIRFLDFFIGYFMESVNGLGWSGKRVKHTAIDAEAGAQVYGFL